MFQRQLQAPPGSFFLFGPRGTGKTTWIQEHFRDAPSYDLLSAAEALRLNRDPSFLARECEELAARRWVVIDEVQKAPLLLDEVHSLIERKRLRFVLSGSSARKLKRGGANLLAGRAEVKRLFPLVSRELDFQRGLEEALEHGMLPLAVTGTRPRAFLKAYVETYLQEEIQAEALVRQIGGFARFLEVAARMNGQAVNAAAVSRDAQVARQTVQGYFQILIDTLIAFWLPAWKLKRSTKQVAHPRFYLFDCGVARHMANLGHLPVHPEERGFLFETFLLHEIRAFLHYRELDYPLSYFSTHEGTEVDLIIETPRGLVAMEFKSGARWERKYHGGLLRFRDLHPRSRVFTFGVFAGKRALVEDQVRILPWREFLELLWAGEVF